MSTYKATLMNEDAINRALMRISHEVIEKNNGCENLCFVGINRRGVPLSKIICENIEKIEGVKIPSGVIDVTYYRDDLSRQFESPRTNTPVFDFDVNGKIIVLVDDVLFTGRTVRAAMDAIMSVGRPSGIQLVVLIDRGHRELPIRGDYIGKNVPTSKLEHVEVKIPPYENEMVVELYG